MAKPINSVVVARLEEIYEVMFYALHFFCGSLVRDDIESAVHLHRVGIDDFGHLAFIPVKSQSQVYSKL